MNTDTTPTTETNSSPDARLARAALSLEGLSVGDAFGERYFTSGADALIAARTLAHPPWHYTDDTQMALSVFSVLRQRRKIGRDALATNFSVHYEEDRGYGDAMNRLVPMIYLGGIWRMLTPRLFGGEGSLGNGAAMRVAPLGAYFADDPARAAAQAARSAVVTHAHPEGVAGAVAVAAAAAHAARLYGQPPPFCADFLALILPHVPSGAVADGLRLAATLPPETTVREAARLLGCGYNATAPDTVPFALWCAGQHLGDYEEALRLTASGLGDIDTTCAIVGGIVALSAGAGSIPNTWIAAREPLPRWPFQETGEI
jgi:ADP-ribosylglycohydrolase